MTSRRGVAILASDGILDWLLPFLESYRQHNPDLPTYLIPFDGKMERTRRAAAVYGVEVVADDLSLVDRLAFTAYPFYTRRYRNRLRKFHCLALPLDEVLYIDIDMLVFRDLSPLFGHLRPGERDFLVSGLSPEWVYGAGKRLHRFLDDQPLFSDGFWITSPAILPLARMLQTLRANRLTFWSVRKLRVYAQPVANFVTHRLGLKIGMLDDQVPGICAEASYQDDGIRFTADGPVDANGHPIHATHWAGAYLTPTDDVFAEAWHSYAAKAAARLRAAG